MYSPTIVILACCLAFALGSKARRQEQISSTTKPKVPPSKEDQEEAERLASSTFFVSDTPWYKWPSAFCRPAPMFDKASPNPVIVEETRLSHGSKLLSDSEMSLTEFFKGKKFRKVSNSESEATGTTTLVSSDKVSGIRLNLLKYDPLELSSFIGGAVASLHSGQSTLGDATPILARKAFAILPVDNSRDGRFEHDIVELLKNLGNTLCGDLDKTFRIAERHLKLHEGLFGVLSSTSLMLYQSSNPTHNLYSIKSDGEIFHINTMNASVSLENTKLLILAPISLDNLEVNRCYRESSGSPETILEKLFTAIRSKGTSHADIAVLEVDVRVDTRFTDQSS